MVLAPQELRPKLEQAIEKRRELIKLINESLEELSGWKELLFIHDAHPYLNEAYAVIFAFLKEQGVRIKGASILDVGYGSRLNAPQELAEQGAQSYAIDPNPNVPYGIQRQKATKETLRQFEYSIGLTQNSHTPPAEDGSAPLTRGELRRLRRSYSKEGYPANFWIRKNQLEVEENWKKLPRTNADGQVYIGEATLELAYKEKMLEDHKFDAVYSNELFEYGALYFPSEEEKWDEISRINLEIIFRKLKDGGIFISRTMRLHIFTEEQLKAAGFEIVCFNLNAESFTKPYGSNEGIEEVNRAHVVVCRKPQ